MRSTRVAGRAVGSALALCLALAAGEVRAQASDELCEPGDALAGPGSGAASESEAALARGNSLAEAGDVPAALAAYAETRRLAEQSERPALAVRAAANAARVRLEAGEGGAVEALRAALEAAEALEPSPDPAHGDERADLLVHIGSSIVRASAPNALADALSRAESKALRLEAARAFAAAAESDDVRARSQALGHLGGLYEADGRHDEAFSLTRRALFAAQAADAPEALYRWEWQIGRLHRAVDNDAEALQAFRRSVRALGELRGAPGFETTRRGEPFQKRFAPIYTGLVDLLLARASAADGAAQQALLVEARDTLEDLKASELRDYYRDSCVDGLLRKALGAVEGAAVVIYPIVLPDRLELVVSQGGTLSSRSVAIDSERFLAEVRSFRRLVQRRVTRQYMPPAQNLYDWIVRPLAPLLGDRGDTLVFVPGGLLRTIPLSALYDREQEKFLVEQHPVAVTPGLSLTEPRPIDGGGVELLAAGISESVQGFAPLPAVKDELGQIEGAFALRSRVLMNEAFSAEAFKSEVSSRGNEIVHIASHGEFSADSAESFVLTYAGKMSMDELSAIVGATRYRRTKPLELLTLSACQTAAGDDRAALGLAGVALRAGARSAVATLWSVNDLAAAALISNFYDGLAKRGLSRAEALRQAKIATMRSAQHRHPAYWSPFLLIGSWL